MCHAVRVGLALVVGIALLVTLGLSGFTGGPVVLATSLPPSDPCAAPPPPVSLVIRGRPTRMTVLSGGGNSLTLFPFPTVPGTLLPGDAPHLFTFTRGAAVYGGVTHVFRHGQLPQHLCFRGPVVVWQRRGADAYGQGYRVPVRLDGMISGGTAYVTLVVGHTVYWVYGIMQTYPVES